MTAYSWTAILAFLVGFYVALYGAVTTLSRYDR